MMSTPYDSTDETLIVYSPHRIETSADDEDLGEEVTEWAGGTVEVAAAQYGPFDADSD